MKTIRAIKTVTLKPIKMPKMSFAKLSGFKVPKVSGSKPRSAKKF